jgi:predicted nuclease of restriction endonuclease-like (RecB) superfamily
LVSEFRNRRYPRKLAQLVLVFRQTLDFLEHQYYNKDNPAKQEYQMSKESLAIIPDDYATVLSEIKERVRSAQYVALKAVNTELISLYWDIGRLIVERQQGDSWGKSIVEALAKDLQVEFPGMSGFSGRNIWWMRQFYEAYSTNEKLKQLVSEIGWGHNIASCKSAKMLSNANFHPHDPQIRLEPQRPHPPDRIQRLRPLSHQSDQFRPDAAGGGAPAGEAGGEG